MQSIIAVLLWATAALGQEGTDVDRADSRFMATVLARLAQRADPIANIYLNQARVEGLSSLLGQPARAAPRSGDAAELVFVEIIWPATHQAQRWQGLKLDRAYRLREGHPSAAEVALPKFHFTAGHNGH